MSVNKAFDQPVLCKYLNFQIVICSDGSDSDVPGF